MIIPSENYASPAKSDEAERLETAIRRYLRHAMKQRPDDPGLAIIEAETEIERLVAQNAEAMFNRHNTK